MERTERKKRSVGETARKTQLKEETEGKERKAEIIQRNKTAKSKCFANNARAAWSRLFKQYCRNPTPGSTVGKATPGVLLERNVVLRQHCQQGSLKCPCLVSLLSNDP